MTIKLLGWEVQARDSREEKSRLKAVSKPYAVRGAAEDFLALYKRMYPHMDCVIVERRKGKPDREQEAA